MCMNMKKLREIKIHKLVFLIWAVFLILLLISLHEELAAALCARSGYTRLFEACVCAGIFIEYKMIFRIKDRCSSYQISMLVYAAAFIVRILTLPYSEYLPTNDFANYFEGACYFAENGFGGGLYEPLESYRIPSFGGQAALNGWMLCILSPTLLGMQVLNCIYTAGICLLIYELGKKIESSVGLLGACIYTFYPMGVLSVHITTNVHGAAFFMLLGIYFFVRAQKAAAAFRRALLCSACAVCLILSDFYHPSVIIVLCALAVYTAGCEIGKRIRREETENLIVSIRHFRGSLVCAVAVILLYGIGSRGIIAGMADIGYVKNIGKNSYLSKIVLGFNYEYNGAWNEPDIDTINSAPIEAQDAVCMRMIKERLRNPWKAFRLMIKKTQLVWFGTDNYDYFYMDGILKRYESFQKDASCQDVSDWMSKRQEAACSRLWSLCSANLLFVYCIWVLAIAGILALLKNKEEDNTAYLLLYIPLGWMAFIMISEMQSRYRYQGMTAVILLAGYGAVQVCNTWKRFVKNIRK